MTKKTKTRALAKTKALILWALLSAFILYPLQPAQAYEEENSELSDDIDSTPAPETPNTWGKWLYFDKGDHVSVCGYTGTEGKLTIPGEINGKPVREISSRNIGTAEDPEYKFFEDYNGTGTSVIVPEGVLSIARYAFWDSFILAEIILPESLKFIGDYAFGRCKQLTFADIPENVVVIGTRAFVQSGLTEINLPDGLKIIGEAAFMASHLTKLRIPESVMYIGKNAFYSTYIEVITLPGGLKRLESNLLSGCNRLRKAYISEGTEAIDSSIFESCPTLEEVYFPSTLKEINAVFSYNLNLKNLYFAADEEQTRLTLGSNIPDRLIGNENPEDLDSNSNLTYYYKNVQITYNTPVPATEESDSKNPLNIDIMTVILIAASIVCLTLSVIFLTGFISEKKQTEAAKAEEAKREQEAFHPEVLGAWECEKCKTLNSPIGKYCYKCGRKR